LHQDSQANQLLVICLVKITDMMHAEITMEDWSLLDCQEYLVDLEISCNKNNKIDEANKVSILLIAGITTHKDL
jgi:hypothetical protein